MVRAGGDTRSVDTWERCPLVLSLADVQLDLEQPWDGYNDGVPPLTDISRPRWVEQFRLAYRNLANTPARDDDHPMDRYAAENAGEYFAVVTELHYSQPSLLQATEPAIASLLEAFLWCVAADFGRTVERRWRAPPGNGAESLMSTGLP